MHKKILTTFLIVFFVFIIFNLNQVLGVGIVSQAWKQDVDGDGKADLLFRTYTTPTTAAEKSYHNNTSNNNEIVEDGIWTYKYNNKNYTSKWVYRDTSYTPPTYYTYSTIGFAFHTEQMGNYNSKGNSHYIGYNSPKNPLGNWIDTITKAYTNSTVVYTTPTIAKNYNDVTFYELMRAYGKETYKYEKTSPIKTTVSNVANNTEWRYCIVNIGGNNVYVADNVVRADQLAELVAKAKEKKVGNTFYVSNIMISKYDIQTTNDYVVSRTVYDFLENQGKFSAYYDFWDAGTRGVSTKDAKATGSIANLYDNQLIVPQSSKRTVLVRHIDIGTNTVISTNIVNNSSRITSNNLYFQTVNSNGETENIAGSKTSVTYTGYEEYYEKAIDIDRSVTKEALKDISTYKCLGYNIAVSTDLGQAQNSIKYQITNGKYNKGTSAYTPAKEGTSDSDYVVIDFYYTEYDKDVYVNHLYVDKDGYVKELDKQNIVPNNTATMAGTTIYRINSDTYRREVYKKKLGEVITTRLADSVKDKVEYKGYEVFSAETDAASLVGKQRTNLNKSYTATLTGDKVQVNFYYYQETQVELAEPERNIEGSVFVDSADNKESDTDNISTTCTDKEQSYLQVTSIPSGTSAKVGITGIPKYMVGAITTDYVSPADKLHTMNLSLTFKMGTQTKTIDFDTINYRVGYYIITDMAIFKLTNTTIYDADNGYDGTSGQSLFNWKNGQLNLDHNKEELNVKLTGLNGRTIANNTNAINNINNYVEVKITDKYGISSDKGSANSTLSRTYLSEEQLSEVDANSDGAVTSKDKTFADNKLNELNSTLTDKLNIQASKQNVYNNAVNVRATLLSTLNAAIAERDRLYNEYKKLEDEKSDRLRNIYQAELDIKTLEETTIPNLEKELEVLQEVENEKLTAKEEAKVNLDSSLQEKERLYQEYEDSIRLMNELEAKANCQDSVDQDIYIYLEQDEKDKLEECKKNKEEYAKYLEDKIVDNAHNKYIEADGNYESANEAYEQANEEYETAVNDRASKENSITESRLSLSQKQTVLEAIRRDYENFIKEKYTPAKEAYEIYRDETVPNAQADYDKDIEDKNVENALDELNSAKDDAEKAQEDYNRYKNYRDNLYNKFDEYKKSYDEFMRLDVQTAASELGLKLHISVQNMSVKVNGTLLTTANENTVTKTYNIDELIRNRTVPQVYANRPVILDKLYSEGIGNKINTTYYTNSNNIAKEKLNGISTLAGEAVYKAQVVIGSKSVKEIEDTTYYSSKSNDEKTYTFKLKNTEISKTYKINSEATTIEEKYKDTEPINIYTPITVSAKLESDPSQIINQTYNKNLESSIIQINTPFTIKLSNDKKPSYYNGLEDTNRFSGGYYVKFDFTVHKVKINGKTYNNGNIVEAGTWIGIIPDKGDNTYITAQAYANLESNTLNIVAEENASYTVRAVAYNATDIMRKRSTKFANVSSMMSDTSELKDLIYNICTNPSYFAEERYEAVIVNRAYNFRVTDVKDVNWKSVFRINSSTNTNAHSGILYYSGTTKWNTKSEKSNDIISRTSFEIGRYPQRILPIGPYKSVTSTYIKAPKIGYRFSFDMKVTGSYYETQTVSNKKQVVPRENKKVEISTRFYYISKDGRTYIPESNYDKNGNYEGIYLFYKTSEGKYVRIDEENGGGYTLTFTPNDGYRYIEDSDTTTLSKTSVVLGNLRKLTLTYNMATVSDNRAIITYYGEYKLPNSTIAVKVDADGTYDINSPLKDGYIGVVFDIVAYSGEIKLGDKTENVLLSYSKDTKENSPNTSQWDYEGYLGYTNSGNKVQPNNPVKMKLEKGTWSITNDIYNEIKGSVMLYDIDEKASTDYE